MLSAITRSGLIIVLIALLGIFMMSCAPVYMPGTPNTPMLKEEGEVSMQANLATTGLELKGGYAITDQWGITAMVAAGREVEEDGQDSYHRYLESSALHTYRPGGILVIENSAGVGLGGGKGSSERIVSGEAFQVEGGYFKPFFQNNLALQTQAIDIALVNRIAIIQFDELRTTGENQDAVLNSPSTPVFWEPTVVTQIGWDRFRLNAQLGLSTPLAGEPDFDWIGIYGGIGFGLRLGG